MNTEVFVGAFIPVSRGQHRRLVKDIVIAYRAPESLILWLADVPFTRTRERTCSNNNTQISLTEPATEAVVNGNFYFE